jgi:hypothetical protein
MTMVAHYAYTQHHELPLTKDTEPTYVTKNPNSQENRQTLTPNMAPSLKETN